LSAERRQLLVTEQLAGAKAGAVDDQPFGKGGEDGGRHKAAEVDLPTSNLHVAGRFPQEPAGLHVHGVEPDRPLERKVMLARLEAVDLGHIEVEWAGPVVRADLLIGRQPAYPIVVADHDLEPAPSIVQPG